MVDWSHDTLSDTSRKVWRRLAVFPGAFSLNGAQAVAGPTPSSRAALEHPAVPRGARHDHTFVYDHHVAAGTHLARALFLSGHCDEALGVARETIERAAASRYINHLTKLADGIARGYRKILSVTDEARTPVVADAALPGYHQDTFATIHPALLTAAVRARAMGTPVWSSPEILRIDGPRCDDAGEADAAHALFVRAIELVREQGSLAWELRAATSLARSLVWRGRNRAVHDVLAPVHARLTQGFATRDAMDAAALLRDL